MFSIINYVEAKRRLKQSAETIEMMGGRAECNEMVLAQHEMIRMEKEYHKEQSYKEIFVVSVITITVFLFLNFFKVF
jgi:uncharacterized membrane protein (DUF106 family)